MAYVTPASGYVSIYRKPVEGTGRARSVVTSGRSAELESFHAFDSRMDGSRPGFLLFTARYGDRDALVVWDLRRHRMSGRYQFTQLVSLLSPHWMPDGQSIVLSGLSESGVSDLYRVRLPGGELEPLTKDRYQDLDPSPSADGRRLVFASDRTAGGLEGAANLFVLDLGTGQVSQLTSGQLGRRVAALGGRWSDLLHVRPGRRAQRLLGRLRRRPAAARPRPGPARSTACRCPRAASWRVAFTT